MKGHPGGEKHTRRMLQLAELPEEARVLDMGAGAGEAVAIMREMGYRAEGIDLQPRSALIRVCDMRRTDYPEDCFDAVFSQCSFFVSGDTCAALQEARRILKPGGLLILSDVFFEEPTLTGFQIFYREDLTEEWREYYFEALWNGESCNCRLPGKKCRYLLLLAKKE